MRISDWISDVCSSDLAGRLAVQGRLGDGDAELRPDQVIGLVHGGIAAAGIGGEPVFLEAASGVVAGRFEHHVDAPAQVARDRTAVALQAGHHLDLALAVEHAALGRGPQRSEEHTSELQSLMRISYAVFCLKKTKLSKSLLN